jgi:aryl-alcohol dehydrogenase-like predicted oxidoreductase
MRYARLGRSGLRVSRMALGTWRSWGAALDYAGAEACFRAAIEAGVNLVDVADVYAGGQAEAHLGWMLEQVRRERIVVATKAFWPAGDGPNDRGLSRKHLVASVEGSLRRLRTDRIDLFLCHRVDPETPTFETVRTLGRLIRDGKLLYWGLCTDRPADVLELCSVADELGVPRPVANQPPYSLLDRRIEGELLEVCGRFGLAQIVFSPLAQGVLTGKYLGAAPTGSRAADPGRVGGMERHLAPAHRHAVAGLVALAAELETSPAAVALAWTLREPTAVASALFGATSAEQVRANVAGASLDLPPEALDRLERLFPPS